VITDFQAFDRCQAAIAALQEEMKRMQARVTALESGAPLPADQPVEVVPEVPTAYAETAHREALQQWTKQTERSSDEHIEIPELSDTGWIISRRS
jgi:hypothetical protein